MKVRKMLVIQEILVFIHVKAYNPFTQQYFLHVYYMPLRPLALK